VTILTRRAVLLGVAGTCIVRRASADPDLETLLADIARARTSLRTLVGPFTQERVIGLLKSKIRSTGTLTLVRPDRLRWELGPPDDVIYWMTPAGLAYKSRSGQGSLRNPTAGLAGALDDVRTLLGGDLGALRNRYDLRLIARDATEVAFEATPLPSDAGAPRLQRLAFALAPDLVRPVRATLIESARDKTEITFGALARDVDVDPEKMSP
jgi:hypothetical protein